MFGVAINPIHISACTIRLYLLILALICLLQSIICPTSPYSLKSTLIDTQYAIPPSQFNNFTIYVRIYCRDKDILNLWIGKDRNYQEAPRFKTYNQYDTINRDNKPQFQSSVYTYRTSCERQVTIGVNSLQIGNQFLIEAIKFGQRKISFRVVDKSTKWGLGERFQQNFHITNGYWTIWNRDRPWMIDHGQKGHSQQTYGHHPVYLARAKNQQKLFHLAYLRNTFGILYQVTENSDVINYDVDGGNNINYVLFMNQKDPEQLLKRYHRFIGGVHIPPFWSMGWHQCRWGYFTLDDLRSVADNYASNDLPLDVLWNDLDYMQAKIIFTINQNTYPSAALKRLLKSHRLHWVPLIDCGVSISDSIGKVRGDQLNVFLKDPRRGNNVDYIAQVWPGQVNYVDFLHPNSSLYWHEQLDRLYQKVPFSGVWLDMNEPSNFKSNNQDLADSTIQQSQSINDMTMDVTVPHYTSKKYELTQRETHAYYGHSVTVATHQYLLSKKQRPFIITRSTSVGSGAYAGHWTGDNNSQWPFLRLSISGNFLFQIFGIQMVGADICGFHLDTNEQLCSRWMQLGSFYPFARNHNDDRGRSQQPYALSSTVLKASREALKQRYSLLRQFYSIFVGLKGVGSFFRPLFFQYYNDQQCYKKQAAQTQFLIGSSIMVAPIVDKGSNTRAVYFPSQSSSQSIHWCQVSFSSLSRQSNPILDLFQSAPPKNQFNNFKFSKCHQSKSSQFIEMPLTNALPFFIPQSKLILATEPALRTDDLIPIYHALCVMRDSQKTCEGAIMGSNEEECIAVACMIKVSISLISDDNEFEVSLNVTHPSVPRQFQLSRITVAIILAQQHKNIQTNNQKQQTNTPIIIDRMVEISLNNTETNKKVKISKSV